MNRSVIIPILLASLPAFGQELKGHVWKCAWCVGVQVTNSTNGMSFNFPLDMTECPDPNYVPYANRTARSTCNAAHYLTTPITNSIAGATALSMMFSITGTSPVFSSCVEEQNQATCDAEIAQGGAPPNCRFYIEHNNDTQITNPAYRWWSQTFTANGMDVGFWPLQLSNNVLFTVSLTDLTKWSDVNGVRADQDSTNSFNDTKAHPYVIGFTCSGIFSYGHGVRLISGNAKFQLQSYYIQ